MSTLVELHSEVAHVLRDSAPEVQDLSPEVSVVVPCLNEAETLAACIEKAQRTFREHGIRGEVVVADNGSSDGSQAIARSLGARVVSVEAKGYGSALMGGIAAARGRYIIMGDADDSYDFRDSAAFLEQLRQGFDLVMGNRFKGGIDPDAMPLLHKYLGNPALTRIGQLFFKAPCGDFHCGLRGFSKTAYERMRLRTTGMEFATEMVVKATLLHMRISEVPTRLSVDGRSRPPHLRTWRDGWRHLRFMLLYSPRWLFLYPGALLILAGTTAGLWLLAGPRAMGNISLDVHTLLYAAMAILVGFQAITFATFTKVFAISEGLLPEDPRLNRLFRFITLEVGLVVGGALMATGLGATLYAVGVWGERHFGALDPTQMLRVVIPAALLLTLGFEVILSSFFLSVLGMRRQ
jgi:glycosyltransferase involved in cell wall biosynthesis